MTNQSLAFLVWNSWTKEEREFFLKQCGQPIGYAEEPFRWIPRDTQIAIEQGPFRA